MTKEEFAAGVERAARRIRRDIRRTPLEPSPEIGRRTGADVRVQWECDQLTGSFKLRGAFNALRSLPAARRKKGVVTASTGNHGLAMSRAARTTGTPLEIFVPETITDTKKKKLQAGGAEVVLSGATCEKAEIRARAVAEATGRVFISPYNDLMVIFGQGTLGLQILQDAPDVEAVLVPVGGGGLAAGIAGYLKARKPGIQVWGVEPRHSAFLLAALRAGRLVDVVEKPTLADAVAGGLEPGSITVPLCRKYLDGILAVSERSIAAALLRLRKIHGRPVEGAGALALAGLAENAARFRGRRVVLIVSGGNAPAAASR